MLGIMALALGITGGFLHLSLQGASSVLAGVTVAILPALFWLTVLFRAARRGGGQISPLLPTMFILGALVAAALMRPLLYDLLNIPDWLSRTSQTNRFLAHILLYGFSNVFVIYMLVRYIVWRTPSFERRIDGVLYSVAVAWGYASMFGVLFVVNQGGVTLFNGGLRLLAQLAASVATAFVVGYFLGRNRFEDMPLYYLTGGVVLAAALNGLMLYAGTELNGVRLSVSNDAYSPWPGLGFSFALLVLTYSAILGLLRRHNGLTKARLEHKE